MVAPVVSQANVNVAEVVNVSADGEMTGAETFGNIVNVA